MKNIITSIFFFGIFICCSTSTYAQKKKENSNWSAVAKEAARKNIQDRYNYYKERAIAIWNYAEVGYKEVKSSALLQQTLRENGFAVEVGVAGIPTAFVATYGNGGPVIGVLAEFDALPGLAQKAVPLKEKAEGNAGHGCGHHLFGVGSVAGAIELKNFIDKNNRAGTIKVFGTPAEEGGSGKVYMVREGLFNGVDVVLHWHPDSQNGANPYSSLANKTAKFRFYGISSHAAGFPERGRSALDAAEAMNFMANMMREHIPADARMHYVITNGGKAPNVVPDFAEVYYYMRHPRRDVLLDLFDRLVKTAEGAAAGTGTKMDYENIGGVYELLPVDTLARMVYDNLLKVGGVTYSTQELEFGKKIQESFLTGSHRTITDAAKIEEYRVVSEANRSGGSTDVGDVSWAVPTVGFRAATWIPGTPSHSWQAVACGGTDIGIKGMIVAATTISFSGIDLLTNPTLLIRAKEEWQKNRGADFKYVPLIGNRKPALNYRD
ncbi:MAG: amidohydrolase [Bacteroidetes bacterium]|nr:amidohydrolase [Bacteroidota bacterium]